jgi:protein O-mannosyl-transferase
VIGGRAAGSRWVKALAIAMLAALAVRTGLRDQDWRSDEAIWTATVRDCPESPRALTNLASTLGAQGRDAETVPLLRQALRLQPNSIDARLNLGLSLLQLGRVDQATTDLQSAVSRDAGSAPAHTALAFALMQQHDLSGAERELKQALRLEPNDVRTLMALASVYSDTGRDSLALEVLRPLASAGSTLPEVHYNLACTLARLNRPEEALASLKTALELGFSDRKLLESDPDLRTLRELPAFKRLLDSTAPERENQ